MAEITTTSWVFNIFGGAALGAVMMGGLNIYLEFRREKKRRKELREQKLFEFCLSMNDLISAYKLLYEYQNSSELNNRSYHHDIKGLMRQQGVEIKKQLGIQFTVANIYFLELNEYLNVVAVVLEEKPIINDALFNTCIDELKAACDVIKKELEHKKNSIIPAFLTRLSPFRAP